MKRIVRSTAAMRRFGGISARRLLSGRRGKYALTVGLSGDLGSGKTTFVQGFLRGLGVRQRIASPTFLIFRPYRLKNILDFKTAYHVDLYRVKRPKELNVLGFKSILKNPDNIVLIEWAEKMERLLPKETVWIFFKHLDETNRAITFK